MRAVAMAMEDHKHSRNTVIKPERRIDDLTDELLVEILQRVPCKSASLCKSVSKRWFALISDPYFTRSFLRYHTKPMEFVVNFYLNEFVVTSQFPEVGFPLNMSFLPCFETSISRHGRQEQERKEACVVGSSNGLLLCCTTWYYQSMYYVCNPLTKHWIVLPPPPTSPVSVLVGFICDSSKCSSSSSIKVVRLSTLHGNGSTFKVENFSSTTGQWTNSVVSCPRESVEEFIRDRPTRIGRVTAIDYNGRLHWLFKLLNVILVYHPNDDKVTFIDCPRVLYLPGKLRLYNPLRSILGVSRGRLRISQLRISQRNICFTIWDYNTGKWCLEHQIHINDLMWNDNSFPPNWEPNLEITPYVLAFHPYADVMYLGFSKCFASCDLPSKTSKFLSEFPDGLPIISNCHGFTLVLPPWPTPLPAQPPVNRKWFLSNVFTNI